MVAVFLEAVDNDNLLMNSKLDSLNTICNCIPEIKYKGSIKLIEKQMNILELYPENRSYYTYLGSLTTPPLWETVIWIIFEDPILCTKNQVKYCKIYIKKIFNLNFYLSTSWNHFVKYPIIKRKRSITVIWIGFIKLMWKKIFDQYSR